jgi:hypothetical protein
LEESGRNQQRLEKFRNEELHNLYYEGESVKVTNGSKTVVMEVIGFLCVSLGSSTVQFHDSLGSRNACACSEADFNSHNGDGV